VTASASARASAAVGRSTLTVTRFVSAEPTAEVLARTSSTGTGGISRAPARESTSLVTMSSTWSAVKRVASAPISSMGSNGLVTLKKTELCAV
jgi:hypothetical protein